MQTKQHTLANEYSFEGKGLHTGTYSHITLKPAPCGTGVVFLRTDLGEGKCVKALAENVTSTARSTTISDGEVSVTTIEHLMSALTGMGVDNAFIEIDNIEVPILDGSALPYAREILKDGTVEQEEDRHFITIPHTVEIKDEKSGSWVRIEPAEEPSADVTVDFNSRVLGVQTAHWDMGTDFATEIAVCRTFVFFHEIEYLFKNNLIKGGDVDNAIVIVEYPTSEEQLRYVAEMIGKPVLRVTEKGYLDNLELHFDNECGRHKLLDLIGDMRLSGGWMNAHITAFKPGHTINTMAAKELRKLLKNK